LDKLEQARQVSAGLNNKTYPGAFDSKLYPATGVLAAGTPLAQVKGTTGATRIGVD
jgi:hypothetical protein